MALFYPALCSSIMFAIHKHIPNFLRILLPNQHPFKVLKIISHFPLRYLCCRPENNVWGVGKWKKRPSVTIIYGQYLLLCVRRVWALIIGNHQAQINLCEQRAPTYNTLWKNRVIFQSYSLYKWLN